MIAAAIIAAAIILVSVCGVLLYNNWVEFNTPAQTEAITDPSAADAVAKMEAEGTSSDSESKDSSSSESSTPSDSASSATSGGSSASTSTNSGGNSSANSGASTKQTPSTVTFSIQITGSGYGNVSGSGTYTLNYGATVYDALMACANANGISVNAGNTVYGIYVSAIGGLAEKEHGAQSGWMYSVNGNVPMIACSGYTLNGGESIIWYYVGD